MKKIKEEWKKIEDFNYEISNFGNLRSLNSGKLRKLQIDKDGYNVITIWKDGKSYFKRINRLVAEAFIPNPYNLPIVNHKDENKKNNCFDNLEWCTVGYNNFYSKARAIIQLDLNGDFICEYESIKDAEVKTGFASSHIQDCCSDIKTHCKTYKGFQWLYKENYNPNKNYKIDNPMPNRGKQIGQYDLDDKFIKIYEKLARVKDDGYDERYVSECCSGLREMAYNCKWHYV